VRARKRRPESEPDQSEGSDTNECGAPPPHSRDAQNDSRCDEGADARTAGEYAIAESSLLGRQDERDHAKRRGPVGRFHHSEEKPKGEQAGESGGEGSGGSHSGPQQNSRVIGPAEVHPVEEAPNSELSERVGVIEDGEEESEIGIIKMQLALNGGSENG